jgi:leucyl aminopeptidase
VFCSETGELSPAGQRLDKQLKGALRRAIKAAGFEGKRDSSLTLVAPDSKLDSVLLLGCGEVGKLEARDIEALGGVAAANLLSGSKRQGTIAAELPGRAKASDANIAALLASGAALRSYSFDRYKTRNKPKKPRSDAELAIRTSDVAGASKQYRALEAVNEGVMLARDLVNEPANVLTPAEFARRAAALAKLGVKIEILKPSQMKRLGMNALLGVAQGSALEPRLVIMRWNGGKRGTSPVAFIGKGVTFDAGGVSIKPAAGMEDMKGDMAGAACVTGLMHALAKRKAKVNAIGAIGIVENAIDGKAQRPGDIVTSMSGQTIAVLNTDAEGRLVLADVLWHIQQKFKPRFMVDLATLTGAIMVALGKEHAGLFSNNDDLAERLRVAGIETGEKVWRMPLSAEYDKLIDHDLADMKNIGGRNAGSITAAQFLQRFVNNVPWAHLDIAGTSMDAPKTAISQSWANGWGVRLLNRLVADHYEA